MSTTGQPPEPTEPAEATGPAEPIELAEPTEFAEPTGPEDFGDFGDLSDSRVEVAIEEGSKEGSDYVITMRDGSKPDGPVLVFTPAEWDAFVAGVRDGEFDLDENGALVELPGDKDRPADPADQA